MSPSLLLFIPSLFCAGMALYTSNGSPNGWSVLAIVLAIVAVVSFTIDSTYPQDPLDLPPHTEAGQPQEGERRGHDEEGRDR